MLFLWSLSATYVLPVQSRAAKPNAVQPNGHHCSLIDLRMTVHATSLLSPTGVQSNIDQEEKANV